MRCIRREVHPVSKLPRWREEAHRDNKKTAPVNILGCCGAVFMLQSFQKVFARVMARLCREEV